MPGTVPLLTALALVALPAAAAARDAVDLALVLAVDISGSIDAEEAAQQRAGYFSAPLFGLADVDADRRAIDVSGDGVNNRGRPVTQARDEAVARGIVINGLPIMNDRPNPYGSATPVEVQLDRYYTENVIGGPGSFIVPAPDFTAFK